MALSPQSRLLVVCVGVVWFVVLIELVMWATTREVINEVDVPVPEPEISAPAQPARPKRERPVKIVMSTGNGMWNSGVWTGYGPKIKTLEWAHSGIVVDKSSCPHKCTVTHSQSNIDKADAVVMEVINHAKFLGPRSTKVPFPFPPRNPDDDNLPILVSFYFEPTNVYPETKDDEFMAKFDLSMGPPQSSDMPVTMVCPWGRPESDYLIMPDIDAKSRLMVYFNEHGIAPEYTDYIQELVNALGDEVDAFQTLKNKEMPQLAKQPSTRIDFMSKYYFVLVTEWMEQDDWVEAEWSQAILAGAVPIYIGAPNINQYAPSPSSFINLRDWTNRPATSLIHHLRSLVHNKVAYKRFFEWKHESELSPQFQDKLDNCVFYAECRLCALVTEMLEA